MKILSIGNSFSQDAHAHLHDLAAKNGQVMDTANLYIGGCSLHTHCDHLQSGQAAYEWERNGKPTGEMISLTDALAKEDWDVITLQQVSHLSGLPATYFPWFGQLYDAVRASCPHAKIYFHRTWAYAVGSDHPGFVRYDNNQAMMRKCIELCADMVQRIWQLPIIPSGPVIEALRADLGDERLHRDLFHLSLDYGRLAAAATWLRVLTGVTVQVQPYLDYDMWYIERIYKEVNAL